MKIGYYKDDLEHIESEGMSAKDIAVLYADENHQIDEESDMNFEIYVEDEEGVLHTFKMTAEYDPVYSAEEINKET
jgi:hypothetical protein